VTAPIGIHPDAFRSLRDRAAAEFLSTSRSRFRADVKAGLATQPVKKGRNSSWPMFELIEIQKARIAGKTDEELRALVLKLEAARGALAA